METTEIEISVGLTVPLGRQYEMARIDVSRRVKCAPGEADKAHAELEAWTRSRLEQTRDRLVQWADVGANPVAEKAATKIESGPPAPSAPAVPSGAAASSGSGAPASQPKTAAPAPASGPDPLTAALAEVLDPELAARVSALGADTQDPPLAKKVKERLVAIVGEDGFRAIKSELAIAGVPTGEQLRKAVLVAKSKARR